MAMATLQQLLSRLTTPTPYWQNAQLVSPWIDYNNTMVPAGYCKDNRGIVRLRGMVKGGASNTLAFTLPEGYRPPKTVIVSSVGGSSAASVQVDPNGQVYVKGDTTGITLEGVTFSIL